MIISPKKTNIAYRCPVCGGAVRSVVGVFSLSGDMMRLRCPCGESELVLKRTSDGKYRFSVPCFACRKNHEFVLSGNVVFSQESISLSCPYTGLDIAFAGSEKGVDGAIKAADEALEQILSEIEPENVFGKDGEEYEGADFSVLPGILLAVKEMMADGRIFCGCEEKADRFASRANNENLLLLSGEEPDDLCMGDLSLTVQGKAFVLKCHACEREYRITEENAEAFTLMDEITLK